MFSPARALGSRRVDRRSARSGPSGSRTLPDAPRPDSARGQQPRPDARQLVPVQFGKLHEHGLALRREQHPNEAAIARTLLLLDQPFLSRALDQSHHRVMTLLQELRQLGNGRPSAPSVTSDAEQKLVLLWRRAAGSRRLLAEAQELAKLVAEPGHLTDQ